MIVILVRKIRPYLPVLLPLVWVLRVLFSSRDGIRSLSFLEEFIRALQHLEKVTTELASRSAWSSGYVPLSNWFFRAVEDVLALNLIFTIGGICYNLYHTSMQQWKDWMIDAGFLWVLHHLPFAEERFDKIGKEVFLSDDKEIANLLGRDVHRRKQLNLPYRGWGPERVLASLYPFSDQENSKWQEGKLSGTVYQGDPEHTNLMNEAYKLYTWSNPLHTGYWPKLNQCSSEVIAMTGNILHASIDGQEPLGVMTSGGTESIFCAIKASLDFYGKRRGIKKPEIICGTSAHAAVDKACIILGIRQIRIDCSHGDFKLSSQKVRDHITSNTILIFASAPTYPQGVIDPIKELSDTALQYDIGLHVDACLGGFVLAFWDEAPKFDFQIPGVTSMSVDTHKFGYAAKGTSVVLYRHKKLRHAQYFCFSKWSGGIYATPTLAGSKAGALEVCAWAALMSIGLDGYKDRVKIITSAAKTIAEGVSKIPGVILMTDKPSMVVCFASSDDTVDIYAVCSKMGKKGWTLNELQNPASIHVCVTLCVAKNACLFVEDLKQVVDELRQEGVANKGSVGIYGMTGNIPQGPVNAILNEFLDLTLAP
jgi:glutamate/tyrosine decarboxylase-like PLP-dependent enzyme